MVKPLVNILFQNYYNKLKDVLVLDSASPVDLMCNEKFVTDITNTNLF